MTDLADRYTWKIHTIKGWKEEGKNKKHLKHAENMHKKNSVCLKWHNCVNCSWQHELGTFMYYWKKENFPEFKVIQTWMTPCTVIWVDVTVVLLLNWRFLLIPECLSTEACIWRGSSSLDLIWTTLLQVRYLYLFKGATKFFKRDHPVLEGTVPYLIGDNSLKEK